MCYSPVLWLKLSLKNRNNWAKFFPVRSASGFYYFKQSFFFSFRYLWRAFTSVWWKTLCAMQDLHYNELKFGPLQWVNHFLYTNSWLWPRGRAEVNFSPCQLSLCLRIEFILQVYNPSTFLSLQLIIINNYKVHWAKPQLYEASVHLKCRYSPSYHVQLSGPSFCLSFEKPVQTLQGRTKCPEKWRQRLHRQHVYSRFINE